ncbi:MAG: putative sulfate exporter family transporter [Gammaproteobacteria bacterium]|nr:putative sulfate exporter family transporter [Gammaproteobacteria bacterium]
MIYLYIVILAIASLVSSNAAISLIFGILFAVMNKKNEITIPKDLGSKFLKTGIILLGGTISYSSFTSTSIDYFPLISLYVFAVIMIGLLLGSLMKIEKKHLFLLVSGTAICGGTAMAALAPIIQSKKEDLASSITIIFLLNLVAIIVFPILGSVLGLTQEQFGIFAALTIHDTASVIGTASIFGQPAMEVATILKLGRTLWIVPLVIFSSWYFKKKDGESNFPYFILLFIAFILISSVFDFSYTTILYLKNISKFFLLLGLFFIGTEISFKKIKQINYKPISFAVILWFIVIGMTSLFYFLL